MTTLRNTWNHPEAPDAPVAVEVLGGDKPGVVEIELKLSKAPSEAPDALKWSSLFSELAKEQGQPIRVIGGPSDLRVRIRLVIPEAWGRTTPLGVSELLDRAEELVQQTDERLKLHTEWERGVAVAARVWLRG